MPETIAQAGPCDRCGNLVSCTCIVAERHAKGCRWRRAAELSIEIACDHGYQACPICDPCDCGSEFPVYGIR